VSPPAVAGIANGAIAGRGELPPPPSPCALSDSDKNIRLREEKQGGFFICTPVHRDL
jgi:hypothetical protein